jgi:hypothetical protein
MGERAAHVCRRGARDRGGGAQGSALDVAIARGGVKKRLEKAHLTALTIVGEGWSALPSVARARGSRSGAGQRW